MVKLTTELVKADGFTFIYFPSSLVQTRQRLRVRGTINGHAFATSAQTWRDGQHLITVNAEMRRRMGLVGGERVEVELEPDTAGPPVVELPRDFATAMRMKRVRADFDQMPPSHRRRYLQWLGEVKAVDQRAERIAKAVEMIAAWGERQRGGKPRKKTAAKKTAAKKPATGKPRR
jgi:hypothetical protein